MMQQITDRKKEKITMATATMFRPFAWAALVVLLTGMQTAHAAPLVYVPLGSDDKIVIVDAATDKIVDTIGGVEAVHGLAKSPDGRFLIAGSYAERDVKGAAVAKPAGVSEDEHAAHHTAPAPGASTAGSVVSTVSVIQTADGAIIRRIDVPGAVHHVSVSPDGRFAVVTHPNESAISVIDLASYAAVTSVSTGPLPNYAVFSPDSGKVYVSNAGNGTVSEVDTERWIVRRNFVTGASPEHMVLSRDGRRLYVANVNAGTVSEIMTEGGSTERTFDIGGALHGIDLSKNGQTLFVSALDRDKLVAINLSTSEMREAPLGPAPYHAAAIGSTGKLYVSSADEPNVWVIDQESLAVRGVIAIGGKAHQIVISPGL
tara:strand:+ start:71250 stop:72368 length:1119 start_codon:yes stop_codon:yes gene_type:complete